MNKDNKYDYIPMTQGTEGGSVYYDECLEIQQRLEADGVLLIVANGKKGNGFAAAMTPDLVLKIPAVLRKMADDIESDMRKVGGN